MSKTKIEWATEVANFIEARCDGSTCDPVSAGCSNCFAQVYGKRLKGIEKAKKIREKLPLDTKVGLYDTNNETIKVNFEVLERKLKELPKKPTRVFLESMSDLFHKEIPDEDILEVLLMLDNYPQHTFLILTKRYERLIQYINAHNLQIADNINFGISICNNQDLHLFNDLSLDYIENRKFFVSFEPLLEEIDIATLDVVLFFDECFNWFIVGAETGNRKRPFKEKWALDILKAAKEHNIPFFFKKQYKNGEWTNKLDGKEYLELPKGE